MIATLRKRIEREDEGFTLIELMVVVLIIAILLAIAIPTFLGAQDRARDRAAQSDLRNGLTAAKTIATDFEGFFRSPDVSANNPELMKVTELQAAEGSLTFGATASDTVVGLYVNGTVATTTAGDGILLAKVSKSGASFGVKATKDGAVTYCKTAKGATALVANTAAYTACVLTKW